MELARQLKAKREERGLSQDEVSKAIFVSRQTISNWENDKTYPDVQSLLLLSQLFEISIDELVRGDVVAMQQAIAEDARRMKLLSIGMLAFSGLAFLFLLVFSLAWPEPSGFARMSKGNLAGAATFIVLYAIGFAMAIAVDRLKKKHDVVTYREIDRFLKSGVVGEPDAGGLAPHHPPRGPHAPALFHFSDYQPFGKVIVLESYFLSFSHKSISLIAIWTAFVAAPFLMLSATTQRLRPFSTLKSRRILPT